ncbi:MAG: VCBS repeat-containing protein, partial [Anaerolineae bacterium]|nr:VCBS repeat-containing protein [Anaerolineae bacterium]
MKSRLPLTLAALGVLLVTTLLATAGPPPAQALTRDVPSFARHDVDDSLTWADACVADLDGDGHDDIVAGEGVLSENGYVAWWENDGTPADGGWTEHPIATVYLAIGAVHVSDLDDDGDPDVIAAAAGRFSGYGIIVWWENDGSPGNGGWTEHIVEDTFDGASDVTTADVDGDGDLDVIGAAYNEGTFAWWSSDGTPADGGWTQHLIADSLAGPSAVVAADLNGDTHVDIVGTVAGDYMAGDGLVAWWRSDGTPTNGGWISQTLATNFGLASGVHVADLDDDQDPDVLAVGAHAYEFTWWENDGTGSLTKRALSGDYEYAHDVNAAELDCDGDMDVLAASTTDGAA